MIRYISSFAVNGSHAMINAALAKMLSGSVKNEKIEILAAKSAINNLKEATKDTQNIKYKTICVNNKESRIGLLIRYLQSAFYNIKYLIKSRKGDFLFYDFNNVFSIAAINFLGRKVYKGRKILVACHGEMEYLINGDKHTQLYKKLLTFLTKQFFIDRKNKKLAKDLHFLVFGDNIINELRPYLSDDLLKRFHSIDHPVITKKGHTKKEVTERKNNGIIHVGTVGVLNKYKGSDNYIELINRLKSDKRIKFSIVGQIQNDLDTFKQLNVKTATSPDRMIPFEEFKKMTEELDYILLLYPTDTYKAIASGAFLDTLRFNKPLIGLSTAYFEYFFQKYGEVGTLVSNIDEMADVIKTLPSKEYPIYDYSGILSRLSPEALTPAFKEILKF